MNNKCPLYDNCQVTQQKDRPLWIRGICKNPSPDSHNQCEIFVDWKAARIRSILQNGGGTEETQKFLIELGELN